MQQQQQPFVNYMGQPSQSQPSPSGSAPNSAAQASLMMPANLAAMAQQGYAQQCARLAQMQAQQQGGQPQPQGQPGQGGPPPQGRPPGGPQWAQQAPPNFPMQMQAQSTQGMNLQQLQAMQMAMQAQARQNLSGGGQPGILGGGGMGGIGGGMGGIGGGMGGMGGMAGLGGMSVPGGMMGRPPNNQAALQNMLLQQQQFQQQQAQHHASGSKKKKHRPSPAHQMFPQHRPPPHAADLYRQQAMAAPPHVAPPHGPPGSVPGPHTAPPRPEDLIEPFTDLVDEIDPKELAMARFRARQEVLTEIFGPEPINTIPLTTTDAWEGLGMDGETLDAKVKALEEENDRLAKESETRLDEWQARLNEIDEAEGVPGLQQTGMEVEVS